MAEWNNGWDSAPVGTPNLLVLQFGADVVLAGTLQSLLANRYSSR
jgi:hypothetical protein